MNPIDKLLFLNVCGGITSAFFDRRVNVEQTALHIERENDIGGIF